MPLIKKITNAIQRKKYRNIEPGFIKNKSGYPIGFWDGKAILSYGFFSKVHLENIERNHYYLTRKINES